jgi:triacylglycerol esterase/lipase EstA (alpha/beta hydrolase family)
MGLFQKIAEEPGKTATIMREVLYNEAVYGSKNLSFVASDLYQRVVGSKKKSKLKRDIMPEGFALDMGVLNPLVVLHGWGQARAVLGDLERSLVDVGFPFVHTNSYEQFCSVDSNISRLDSIVGADIALTSPVSGKVDFVGHSLGGMLAKRYSQMFPDKVGRVFQIGSPNHGTFVALAGCATYAGRLAPLRQVFRRFGINLDGGSALEMIPYHPFIKALNDPRLLPKGVKFYSIYSEYDELMLGVRNTEHIENGVNIDVERDLGVPYVGHAGLIHHPVALERISGYIMQECNKE